MDEVTILKELVRFDTIKDKENNKILDYIEKYLLNLGFKTEIRDKFLVMTYGEKPRLGFIGHSDTVEFIDGWKSNPHELTEVGDNLYGLGACDMKGGIACFLALLSNIELSKLNYGIKIYITYDEEIGFSGIKDIVKLNTKLPEYLIIGEPTDNKTMTGCKGLFAVKIYTDGIKVHSSTPDRGKSANSNMVKLLNELEKYYNDNIKIDKNEKYEVEYTTMNIGLLNGGSAINSVAASCMSYIDFRTIDNSHVDKIKNKLNELCDKFDGRYEVDVDVKTFYNEISFLKDTSTAGFMTEASFVSGNRIILGPGPMTAHEVDEHVSKKSLKKCIEQYKNIINNVCK